MVITNEADRAYSYRDDCSLCGGPLKVPFVAYAHKEAAAGFCSECCTTMRVGLMKDMVRTATLVE
jgi:hypothetical protein